MPETQVYVTVANLQKHGGSYHAHDRCAKLLQGQRIARDESVLVLVPLAEVPRRIGPCRACVTPLTAHTKGDAC